jgi:hypothetical protein
LLGRAFAAVGPAPSWAHLESVVAALKRSGDPAAAALLSRAAEGQPDAMDEVRMIAFANGSSHRPLATAQGSDLTSVGGSAVADTSSGVTVAGGRQPPGTLPFIRGWTLDGHPTRRGRFGALL